MNRVLRVVWCPIRHVGWVGPLKGPDDRKVARCISVAGERGGVLIAFDADSVREKFCFWRGSVSAGRRVQALGSLVHTAGCMNLPIGGKGKAYPVRLSLILRLILSLFQTSPVVVLFFSIFRFHRPIWVARRLPCVLLIRKPTSEV